MKTVAKSVISCYELIRQLPGSESIGGVTILIEPHNTLEFINSLPANYKTEEWDWVSDIVEDVVRKTEEDIGIKVTLTDIKIHPIDSRAGAYKRAAQVALENGLKNNLIEQTNFSSFIGMKVIYRSSSWLEYEAIITHIPELCL